MARYIVCYDVSDNRRRSLVSARLAAYGARAQNSVFELPISRDQMADCRARLDRVLDPEVDRIAVYRLCGSCERQRLYLGRVAGADRIGEEEVFIV